MSENKPVGPATASTFSSSEPVDVTKAKVEERLEVSLPEVKDPPSGEVTLSTLLDSQKGITEALRALTTAIKLLREDYEKWRKAGKF